MQKEIKEGKNTQVLKEYEEREIEALASHPILQNAENAHKYMEEVQHTQQYMAQHEARILQDIETGNIVTNFEKSPELQAQLAHALKESIVDILPNEARAKFAFDNRNFIFRHDTNLQITGIHEIKPQIAQPKNYDEFMALERKDTQELESIKEQTLKLLNRNQEKTLHKEQRGIYNVTYNGKNATFIRRHLDAIDSVIALRQGYHKEKTQRGKGAKHIKIKHLTDSTKEGYVTDHELVNMGQSVRKYLNEYKEPYIETNGNAKAFIYMSGKIKTM